MAFSASRSTALLSLLLLLSTAAVVVNGFFLPQKKSHLRVYFHEFFGKTSYVVTSLHLNTSSFGDIRVFDNAVRRGPEVTSDLVGRAQGITVDDSLEIHTAMTPINFVFTSGRYNGSSLAVYGMTTASIDVNDHPVIGGSGLFRMSRGYGLSKILTYNASYILIQWDFFVYHY